MKNYNQSPLPFQGQKRRFLNEFKVALASFPEDAIYVDLFGGSGLLSHTVKQAKPEAKVVYNDFDGFSERLRNIPRTNLLLVDIREILKSGEKDKKVSEVQKAAILARISKEVGFVDYITLSGSLLFSGKYAKSFEDLSKQTFYNKPKQTDYVATGYLEGVEVVSKCYKELFAHYASQPVVFLIDPPYLSTDSSSYNSEGYWRLTDYLDVLTVLQNKNYFYFTSNKSSIIELCEWMSSHSSYVNPFAGSGRVSVSGSVNYSAQYEDIMVYKKEVSSC